MSETINISAIAEQISEDIFKRFLWQIHPKRNDNFTCVNPDHKSSDGSNKSSHPGDAVFFYDDPYLKRKVYLHTDLKSYAESSITTTMIKGAINSLCMAVECANQSDVWREKYSVDTSDCHEVRGLLFVHNYTYGYEKSFYDAVSKCKLQKLPIPIGIILHFLGPHDIRRLYSIGNDIIRLIVDRKLPNEYTFYYPDLMLFRRHGDVWGQAATIESLTGPYIIIKHGEAEKIGRGYLIYFNRESPTIAAWEYFVDSLSRYQMLESGEKIRIRYTGDTSNEIKSNFQKAKARYAKAWGYEESRIKILDAIEIEAITSVANNFSPGATGWRE